MDILWILIAAILVFTMQAGFLCLESGMVRSKNSINVAAKNLSDFVLSSAVFWSVGFAFMFGNSYSGLLGTTYFFFGEQESPRLITIFLFQMMFCGTAVTLVSGAVAERMTFLGYLIVTLTITLSIYPVIGHWAWGGIIDAEAHGWLEKLGFVDFAGSTVVHSVGGWVALAAILIIGPRIGRFEKGVQRIPGSNLPLAVLGCLLLWFGWFGFNGGSTLAWNAAVPGILLNTSIAAVMGGLSASLAILLSQRYVDIYLVINGILGGLVSITANCHAVSVIDSAVIGSVGGLLVYYGEKLLEKFKIDDSVGVVPVHLFAGIWGTLAVALFGDGRILGKGLSMAQQLEVQATGIISIGAYSFVTAFAVLTLVNRFYSLRVSRDAELMGLNVAEHHVTTEVFDLLSSMQKQQQDADFSKSVPVEPFTEVGQIAKQYNLVLHKVDEEIKQRDKAFQAFRESEFRNGAILNAAMDCIISIDNRGNIIHFNPAAEKCFGVGKNFVENQNFFSLFFEEENRKVAMASLAQGFLSGEGGFVLARTNVTELHRSNGEPFPAEVVITRTTDEIARQEEYTFHVRDITKRVKLQDRLRFLAYHDPLTGLFNRNYFIENLRKQIKYQKQARGAVVLMFIDLDHFKKINDSLGHNAGDKLLVEVAHRLESEVRGGDVVSRWGGDEFVIMISGDNSEDFAASRAEKILRKMDEPFMLAGKSIKISFSLGVAISNEGNIDADRLLQRADLTMYAAKSAGRNKVKLFSDDLEVSAQNKFRIEVSLPESLANNDLYLLYQPKVACEGKEIIGFEALLRWSHPQHGEIMPSDFIPIIEESRLIEEVGEYVLEKVFNSLRQWIDQGLEPKPVAVNISGRHFFSPGLLNFIKSLSEKYAVPCSLIELEITEGVLADSNEENIGAMRNIRECGIRLSIDDFGTGYSSLSYLRRFPIDVLKIDRAFVNDCARNAEDAAICTAIIAVAKSIGLKTIAEGVEAEEQLAILAQQGCYGFQGYLFSRPLLAEEISSMLAITSATESATEWG